MPLKKIVLNIFAIFYLLMLTGCLGNYPVVTSTTSNVEKKTKEEKVKESISNHLTTSFAEYGEYKNFQFGELFMYKPKEIKELDELISVKNNLPIKQNADLDNLDAELAAQDTKIEAKKLEIKEKKIYPWYEVNHIFAIIPKDGDSTTVYEYDFEVYPNYSIKDVHQKMILKLSPKEFKSFKRFFNQDPVYESEDYYWASNMNNTFYVQCFSAIENEDEYTGELIRTILKMSEYIRSNNEFKEGDFTLKLAKEWVFFHLKPALNIGEYSELTPVIETYEGKDIITGYEINHTYSEAEKENKITFYFDLNFVLIRIKNNL